MKRLTFFLWLILSMSTPSMAYQSASVASYGSLTAAVTALSQSTEATYLLVDSATSCTSNTTVPSHITITVTRDGRINQGSYTLTINGPFSADWSQVFTGTGPVLLKVPHYRLEWFSGAGDDSTSNNDALNYVATGINAVGAGTIELLQKGIYRISPSVNGTVAALNSLQGFSLVGSGATIKDVQTYSSGQSATLFSFTNSSNIYIDSNINFISQASDNSNNTKGLTWFKFLQGCQNISGGGNFAGGLHAFYPQRGSGEPTSYISARFDLRFKATNVYYPFLAERSGDLSRLDIHAVGCGRNYFAFGGGSNSTVNVYSKNQWGATLVASASGGEGVDNLTLDYYDRDSDNNNQYGFPVGLQFSNQTPAVFRNIKIRLNIKNPASSPFSHSFNISKLNDSSGADTGGRGHILDGFELSGISDEIDGGHDHVRQIGAFASPDKINNFRICDLHASGQTAGSSRIILDGLGDALQDVAKIEDVYMPQGVIDLVHSTGTTVFNRCTAQFLSDSAADTSKQEYYSCNITQSAGQSTINKKFVNTYVGTWLRGSTNGNTINTGSVANNATFDLSLNGIVNQQGFLMVTRGGGTVALFNLQGGNHFVQKVLDPSNIFSTTAGTAGKINIYWSSGNARYELENKVGDTESAGYELTYFTRMD